MAPEARLGELVEIYDGLDSNNPDAALSANQGRVLNQKINTLTERVNNLGEAGSGSGSDTTLIPATDAAIDALFE